MLHKFVFTTSGWQWAFRSRHPWSLAAWCLIGKLWSYYGTNAHINKLTLTLKAGEMETALRQVLVPVISQDVCISIPNKYYHMVTPRMFCAGYSYGHMDACQVKCKQRCCNWVMGYLVTVLRLTSNEILTLLTFSTTPDSNEPTKNPYGFLVSSHIS